MLRWTLPRSTNFFDLFEKQIAIIVASSHQFADLVHHIEKRKEIALLIREQEHQVDHVAHQCIEELHKTFITPFERNEIYRLVTKMDDIMDGLEETIARIHIYEIYFFTPEFDQMASLFIRAVKEVEGAVKELRFLKKTPALSDFLIKIHSLENQADIILREALSRLFKEESDIRNLIKWKEIYENLEEAIDSCEDVANIIEGIILETA